MLVAFTTSMLCPPPAGAGAAAAAGAGAAAFAAAAAAVAATAASYFIFKALIRILIRSGEAIESLFIKPKFLYALANLIPVQCFRGPELSFTDTSSTLVNLSWQ